MASVVWLLLGRARVLQHSQHMTDNLTEGFPALSTWLLLCGPEELLCHLDRSELIRGGTFVLFNFSFLSRAL